MMNETTFPLSEAQTNLGKRLGVVAKRAYAWHALEAAAVIHMLDVDPDQGLTAAEVASRRLGYGSNSSDALASRRRNGLLLLLFSSVVIGFLLTAAVLNRAVADRVEAFSILAVLAIMAIVGFGYLLKGAHELDAVQDATRSKVRVRRDRQETDVIAEELVPGDIIILGAGDCVSADARLIKAEQLHVQETALTGKSSDVEKLVPEVPAAAPVEMRQSMVYLGTTISTGSGVAVVVATGLETEVGKIAARDN
jgi:P-type Ca2+ transporter type 2C